MAHAGEHAAPQPSGGDAHPSVPIWPIVIGLVVGGAGLGGGFYLSHLNAAPPPETAKPTLSIEGTAVKLAPGSPQWRYITIAAADRGDALAPVPAPARVAFDESRAAPVFAPAAGRVENVPVQLGQKVKIGDRLLSIRSTQIPELAHDVGSARAAVAVKSAAVARVRDLVALHVTPEKDLQTAELELREAQLNLQAAEGKQRSLRIGQHDASGGLYWVTAPRAGTVVERKVLAGMEVGPDRSDPMLVIADLDEVAVIADVVSEDAATLAKDQTARVIDPSLAEPMEGTVNHVAEVVDPVRRTVAVRVMVANPEHLLRPNAFVRVQFMPPKAQTVIVPSDAVVSDDVKTVMFIEASPGRLERREVHVGRVRDGKTEILEGVKAGERYVSHGALLLLNALDLGS